MSNLSLRERKYAATKAALQAAVLKRLNDEALEDINVKDVCEEVQVSETTFFNYFASKQDVIGYTIQIWSIAVNWEMQQIFAQNGKHLLAIRRLFEVTAQMNSESLGLMGEILAYQAKMREAYVFTPLTRAEYAHHFPNAPGIDEIQALGIDELLQTRLSAAKENGELPPESDLRTLTMTLIAIFFVTPVIIQLGFGGNVQETYRRQLDLLLPN